MSNNLLNMSGGHAIKFFTILFCVFHCVVGCRSVAKQTYEAPQVKLAKEEVARKFGWRQMKVETVRTNHLGNWQVWISRIPARPGSHVMLEVSDNEVLRVIPGL